LDKLVDLPSHGVLDEHHVTGHPADDLTGAGVLVEESHMVEGVDGK
jgi:hypothetical protein